MLRKTLATLWLLVACAGPAAAASVWFADNANLYRVDPASNKVNKTLANAGVVAIASGSGDTWAIVGTQLKRYDASGTLGLTVSLATVGVVQPQLLQVDPYDKSVWLSGAAGLVHLDRAGQLIATRTLSTPAGAMALHADQGIWAMVGKALTRVSPAGAVVASRDLTGIVATNPALLAIDSILGYAWIGDGASLVRVDLGALAAPPSVFATGAAIDRIGVHPKTGQAWVVQGTTLKIFAATGALQATIGLGASGLQSVRSIAYDETNRAFWLGDQAGLFRFSEAGAFVAKVDKAVPVQALAGEAFSILPTLSILKPVDGSITSNTRPPIVLGLDAKCAAGPCALPPNYPDGYRVNATLDSLAIGGLFQFDPATGRTTYTPNSPLPAGTHALAAMVTDEFGHSTAVVNSAFRVEAVNPAAPGQCATTPTVVPNASFVPFAALERLEIRGGRPAGADWEWGLGTNTQQSGKFVNENLDWVSGRAYQWTLSYDGAGSGRMTVIDGNTTLFSRAFTGSLTEGLRAGNAINFYVKATADSGAATVALSVNEVNGAPVAASLATAGSGVFSDAALTLAIPLSSHGFTAGGTVTLNFPGASPPQGSRLNAIVTAGNVLCAAPNQPPAVAIVSPAASSRFDSPASVAIEANASDPDGTISKVEFFANSLLVGTSNSAPFSAAWSATTGSYLLTAKATDDRNASAVSAPVSVSVTEPLTDSQIRIVLPSAGATPIVGDSVRIEAEVVAGTRPIAYVELSWFQRAGSNFGDPVYGQYYTIASAPYRVESVINRSGEVFINAEVIYADPPRPGVLSYTAAESVRINVRENKEPRVGITSPHTFSKWVTPATIPIHVEALDLDGSLTKVELFANGVKLAETSGAPLDFTWASPPVGHNIIYAQATDNKGLLGRSQSIVAIVAAGSGAAPPSLTVTSPVDGTQFGAAGFISVTADTVDPLGLIKSVHFYVSADLKAVAGAPPFTRSVFLFNSPGTYGIWAMGLDANGQPLVSSNVVRAIVGAPNAGPVRFLDTSLTGSIVANEGDSTRIKFLLNEFGGPNGYVGYPLLLTPYNQEGRSATWVTETPGAPGGYYAVRIPYLQPGLQTWAVEARDANHYAVWSSAFTINVNARPRVSIDSPQLNQLFSLPAAVEIAVSASDPDGSIAKMELFINEQLVSTFMAPPYRYSLAAPPVGGYDVRAVATDDKGATGEAGPLHFEIVSTNNPPSCAITSPEDGAAILAGDSVEILAAAEDSDGAVVKVEFYSDTTLLGQSTQAPYRFTWPSATPGAHALTVKATDNLGGVTTSAPVGITAYVGNLPPRIKLVYDPPVGGYVFGEVTDLGIYVNAQDADGTVVKLELFEDTTLLSSLTLNSSYINWDFNAGSPSIGVHNYTVRATDNAGATATVTLKVTINPSPSVSLVLPRPNAFFIAPASIEILATATQQNGTISNVNFYDGNTLIDVDRYPPYGLRWTGVAAGIHTITATVVSSTGYATSAPVTIVVGTATQPTLSRPWQPYFVAPADIRIAVQAGGVSGATSVEFFNGTNKVGESSTPPFTMLWRDVGVGSYLLTARIATASGETLVTPARAVTVLAQPNLTIDTGIDGGTVLDRAVTISGTVQAPANSAIVVNGVTASIDSTDRWYAQNVPLVPGSNPINVTLAMQEVAPVKRTISVTRAGSTPFTARFDGYEGIVPFTPKLTISRLDPQELQRIEVDIGDDGSVEGTTNSLVNEQAEFDLTIPDPGAVPVRVRVYDPSGTVVFNSLLRLNAKAYADGEAPIAEVYSTMLDRLGVGKITAAEYAVSGDMRFKYRDVFANLAATLPGVVSNLGEPEVSAIGSDIAEILVTRTVLGVKRVFPVHLIRGDDGVWRIEGM